MEAAKQAASMIANTGVVVFAGTTVAYFLSPETVSALAAVGGFVLWVCALCLAVVITMEKRIWTSRR